MYKILTIALLFLSGNALADSHADKLKWLTEELYPYNYTQGGEFTGLSYEIIENALRSDISDFKNNVEVLPWSRAFSLAQTEKNTALFSTARTKNRVKLFHWVGPIADARRVAIYKKSSNVKLGDVKDISNYSSTVVLQDSGDYLLRAHKISEENIQKTQDLSQSLRLLKSGLVDIMVYNEAAARVKMKEMKINPDDYNFDFTLSTDKMYIAISKSTSSDIVKHIQSKIDAFKKSKAHQELLVKYNFK